MGYNFAYDICALPVLMVLLAITNRQRQAPFLQNRRFVSVLLCTCGLVAFDIMNACTATMVPVEYAEPLLQVTSYLYFIFLALTAFMVVIYAFSLIEITPMLKMSGAAYGTYFPVTLWMLFIASNPFHRGLFWFDEAGIYHRGNLQILNYIFTVYYIIFAISIVVKNRAVIDNRSIETMAFFALAGSLGAIIQYIYPQQLITPFCITAGVLVMFLTVQRPDTYLDSSTGMLNKSTFDRLFNSYIHSRRKFGIVHVYIEDLRLANQAIGVDRVNHIMRQIGEFLEEFAMNRTFYVGVSTFMIIVDQDEEGLEEIANKVHKRFESKWTADGSSINMSCRTLFVRVPEDATDIEQVVAYNQCLVDAQGLETTFFRASDMNIDSVNRRLIVESCIKRAIDENNFVMYYQPIVSTSTGKVVSAEALIRLIDPDYGFIPPDEFIVIAEKNGSILKIGEIVFRNVFSFIRDNDLKSKGIEYIEINLSVVQCMQEDMSEKLLSLMEEYEVDSGRINLEITETAAIESSRTLVKNMNRLVECNVSFALDDFGSGYANMNSVLDLPLDMVKFDKHMVDVATEKDKGKIVLANSATMIKSMDMEIVAEGVETETQVEEMKKMGVDYIQGFYYSRPVPGQAFIEFVDEFNGIKEGKTA